MKDAPVTAGTSNGPSRVSETVARVAAIVVLVIVVGLLASTYIGHSSSPYGVCYGRSGRSVPCVIVARDSAR